MTPDDLKSVIAPFRSAAETATVEGLAEAISALVSPGAEIKLCHPLGTGTGGDHLLGAMTRLVTAMPDLERRDMILLAGTTPEGQDWIGACGNYMGTFTAPFLGIPPTGHLAHVRYHEFFRVEAGKVTEMQAIWDIPELMMQARAWPMAPQLGAFLCTPGPMSGDGLFANGDGQATMDHVIAMLTDLSRHPSNPDPEIMQPRRYWHPRFNWYGPAGIGTGRGLSGFRHWHQMPFLNAMPDRQGGAVGAHWVAQGEYVCETGWPNMAMTITGDGFMGIAPSGQDITMRSLDFWRMEGGLIRENWVLVDLLDVYRQIGVDVLGRMAEFNKARPTGPLLISDGMPA